MHVSDESRVLSKKFDQKVNIINRISIKFAVNSLPFHPFFWARLYFLITQLQSARGAYLGLCLLTAKRSQRKGGIRHALMVYAP